MTTAETLLSDLAVGKLIADIGPLPWTVTLDVAPRIIRVPLADHCDCGYLHGAPVTCEVGWTEPEPLNPSDPAHLTRYLVRACVPCQVRDAAQWAEGVIRVELGLILLVLGDEARQLADQLTDLEAS